MDIEKLFPKGAYDLISRLIPGAVLLLAVPVALGHDLDGLLSVVIGSQFDAATSTAITILFTVFVAYLSGTLLATVSGLLGKAASTLRIYPELIWLANDASKFVCRDKILRLSLSQGVRDKLERHTDAAAARGATDASNLLMLWYADALDSAGSIPERAQVRDLRGRYRMLEATSVAFLIACSTALVAETGAYGPYLLGLMVITGLAALRERFIFQREIIRRAVKDSKPTQLAPGPESEPTLQAPPSRPMSAFKKEWLVREGQQRVALVGTETDVELLHTHANPVTSSQTPTPFGPAHWEIYELDGEPLVFFRRYRPGLHRVWNGHANAWLCAREGIESVIGIHGAGAIDPSFSPGALVVPTDFLDWSALGDQTFSALLGVEVFARLNPPFCPRLTGSILGVVGKRNDVKIGCTRGPRIETPMEVAALKVLGASAVGMKQGIEAVLARESATCFASVSIILNAAESVEGVEGAAHLGTLTAGLPREKISENLMGLVKTLRDDPPGDCTCRTSLDRLRARDVITRNLTELAPLRLPAHLVE